MEEYLEAGRVASTHGVRGEVRLECWCDGPQSLLEVDRLYLEGQALEVESARPHKHFLLVKFRGVDTVEAAMALKGKVLKFCRDDVALPQGRHFVADLLGLFVVDDATGVPLGRLREVLMLPAQEVYVVQGETGERLVPAVPEFIKKIDLEKGEIRVRLIEGM